ncbi:hypothetical protein RF11_12765 [Thelohanellus kitauei]|uniref:Tc1-like transposase DDE domain-containing protein n=1 Tax=Thelohanellus kitauei TaxID=669202 RepID=A0A0C2MI69_THEKT|nr:hypothetical protein RF11_12765 [Thelohanellus kitauei]
MILAASRANVVNSEAVQGSVNTKVRKSLLASTKKILSEAKNFIFVMDNVDFHHAVTFRENSNFSIVYLPPHSPMLNTCVVVISIIKFNVRRNSPAKGILDLISRMNEATQGVSSQNLENCIMH